MENEDGDTAIILTKYSPSKGVTFDGVYMTDISASPNVQIKFGLNNRVIITGGCNTWNADYLAY